MWANSLENALENASLIRSLVLQNKGLKKVLPVIWQFFPLLELLDLSGNQIKTIPKSILKLPHLKRLIIADNQLLGIPSFLKELEGLKVLDAQNNRLHTIEALPLSLEVLNLSKNKLKTFPTQIKNCAELLHLDLSYNKLGKIPALYYHFPALRYLNCNQCQLQSIGLLPSKLHALFLAKNRINKLPENWQKMTMLQRFDIASNPIQVELFDDHQLRKISYVDVSRTKTKWPNIEWLLEQFLTIEHSRGGFSASRQQELSALIYMCGQKPNSLSKQAVFKLIKSRNDGLFTGKTLDDCLASGIHPDIQVAAFSTWLKKYSFKIPRSIRGLRFVVLGAVFQSKEILKKRLAENGALLVDQNEEPDVIIMGYKNWPKLEHIRAQKVIDERGITIWLDKKEGRYLTVMKRNNTEVGNIERMLKSKDAATFNLGLSVLQSWGTPQALLVILLGKWLSVTVAQKEKLQSILRPYLPTAINILLTSEEKTLFPFTKVRWIRTLWKLIKSK